MGAADFLNYSLIFQNSLHSWEKPEARVLNRDIDIGGTAPDRPIMDNIFFLNNGIRGQSEPFQRPIVDSSQITNSGSKRESVNLKKYVELRAP